MKIVIASDHAGFLLKSAIVDHLSPHFQVLDLGPSSNQRVDYPDYAQLICQQLQNQPDSIGIAVCGSGVGISIACNKHQGIQCGLALDLITLPQIIKHCNVLALGERVIAQQLAIQIVDQYIQGRISQS